MIRPARFNVASDLLPKWRDSLFSGQKPRLYEVGAGSLDNVELGPGRVVLVGGAPGSGKTALAMQLVVDALRSDLNLHAVVTNVEMSPDVLLDRQLARLSGVPLDLIAGRALDGSHAERIDRGISTIDAVAERMAFVDAPYDLENVATTADAFGAELLFLDYLQRIRPPGERSDKRGSVDALMDYLRQFADAGRAVFCVSAVARGKDRKGRSTYDGSALGLASFRESSELEYGADTAYLIIPDSKDPNYINLRCLKHRHGEPIDIDFEFNRSLQRFSTPKLAESTMRQTVPSDELAALYESAAPALDDESEHEAT